MRADPRPEAAERPVGVFKLANATVSQPEPEPGGTVVAPVPRLALRLDEVAASLGMERRTIERERAAGRFPQPDLKIGKCPLWQPETIRAWVARGGGR